MVLLCLRLISMIGVVKMKNRFWRLLASQGNEFELLIGQNITLKQNSVTDYGFE